jgi:hypothetical protein
MLSKPSAFYRAAWQHIRFSPDAVWIIDDALLRASDNPYSISKASRRHGSTVPGPMESRRRFGKRQLASLSEITHIPIEDYDLCWSLNGSPGRHQWQWEAPTKHQPAFPENSSPLPSWLTSYETTPLQGRRNTANIETSTYQNQCQSSGAVGGDLHNFRTLLKVAPSGEMEEFCRTFTQSFKQNLILALVPETVISTSLRLFTQEIWKKTTDQDLAVSRCMSFYCTTWEGIKACKVLQPTELGSDVLSSLLFHLSQLESSESVQILVSDIIHTLSTEQLLKVEEGLLSVVKAWVPSWIRLSKAVIGPQAQREDSFVSSPSKEASSTMKLNESVLRLSSALGRLPPELASKIVCASADHVINSTFFNFVGPIRILRVLRYSWVSMVANMPCVDEDLLLHIWNKMDFLPANTGDYAPKVPRLTMREGCKVLLDYWINHNQIRAPESVKATFLAAVQAANRTNDARHLLEAIDQHKEQCWSKAKFLFRFLRKLGKPHAVLSIFRALRWSCVKFSASFVASEVKEMSLIDAHCALNIYMLYPTLRCENRPLLLDGCSGLVMAMINDSAFKTADIWRALRIPLYNPRKLTISPKRLGQARINLVHKMALEFSQAQCRPPRVALRNVMQCVMYLRRHNVPLTAELTRAISYAGITRELLREHWVGTEKLLWILDLVKRVEGEDIAKSIDMTLSCWQARHTRTAERPGYLSNLVNRDLKTR